VNPWRAPQGVGLGHPADEGSDLGGDGGAAGPMPSALPGPEEPETGAVPLDDGRGLDDEDGRRPASPEAGKQDPEHAVGGPHPWPRRGALEDGQLMPQREVLEHQGAVGPDRTEEAGEDEGEHGGHHPAGRAEVQS
jgi:hypothetical protein